MDPPKIGLTAKSKRVVNTLRAMRAEARRLSDGDLARNTLRLPRWIGACRDGTGAFSGCAAEAPAPAGWRRRSDRRL
jgi:hypothetical protein